MKVPATNITEVIKALVEEFISGINFHPKSAEGINGGLCDNFAHAVTIQIPGAEALWGDGMDEEAWDMPYNWVEYHAAYHCFVRFKNRYYDSEEPEGVDHPMKLPYYQRELRHFNSR
ncbi:MAG: hypothetical protein HOG49_06235 [Candidatus Scalindua sp.]|jgi:hypothetical protein|nr:hypothetical protein [Candidatus Scalindua sp.]